MGLLQGLGCCNVLFGSQKKERNFGGFWDAVYIIADGRRARLESSKIFLLVSCSEGQGAQWRPFSCLPSNGQSRERTSLASAGRSLALGSLELNTRKIQRKCKLVLTGLHVLHWGFDYHQDPV